VNVKRLNHAVLWVRDAGASAAFYGEVLGFRVVEADPSGRAVFLRAGGSDNHHDLGLFSVGDRPAPRPQSPGLYHLAWQVETIDDLAAAAGVLGERGSLVGATDHGVSKSLYAKDPDGIEFEVMWQVPTDHWGEYAEHAGLEPLDLPAEVGRWAGVQTG
jgi:catechol-2,3-dioxygenase